MLHKAGADGIEMHVPRDGPEVCLILNQLGPVSALEHVTAEVVPSCRGVGVRRQEALHASRQVGLGRLQHQVQMIGQDHEREDLPRRAVDAPRQLIHEPLAVVVVADDVLAAVSTGHDMVDRAGVLDA